MAEYETDNGGWVCSSGGTWLVGSYETRKAARLAYRVSDQRLSAAWEAKRGADGIIHSDFTEAEVRALIAWRAGK